ncbi:hypothetical protein WJX72_003210 [[Myrmecia] bisecta]|uniref:Uncharacterized protein n=1 Tax=[Myrmecia] bisecta TaxID=41462 RepID=A0AAW1P6Y6_9CHLO
MSAGVPLQLPLSFRHLTCSCSHFGLLGGCMAAAGGNLGPPGLPPITEDLPGFEEQAQPVQTYPLPLATHEEVIADPALFQSTLQSVHLTLGIQEKVPRVGGRELDLYQLYRNVCSLGGCAQVIARKQWRDAAESFHFPETITSVSYVLRKAYMNFLWDYEQIYYFRVTGARVPQPQSQPHSATTSDPGDSETPAKSAGKKRKQDAGASGGNGAPSLVAQASSSGQPDQALVGTRGTVNIDARFDAGYFVTIKLGRDTFRGMLYYPPGEHAGDGRARRMDNGAAESRGTPRRERGDKGKDPHAPKPNKTPFSFFSVDARLKAREANPGLSPAELTKKVGEMWANATDQDKAPYIAMSNQDRTRYTAELEAYNYRLAAQAATQQAQHATNAVAASLAAAAQQPLTIAGETFGVAAYRPPEEPVQEQPLSSDQGLQ